MSTKEGAFITLEGIDASGKSTQATLLGEWLSDRGIGHVITREPGGTPFGGQLRDLLLAPNSDIDDPMVELLLFVAARRRHIDAVIRPAVRAGTWVVCDRFSDSTLAYQCGGKGLDLGQAETIFKAAGTDLQPDMTALIDIPAKVSVSRRKGRAEDSGMASPKKGTPDGQGLLWEDGFEAQQQVFFERVGATYHEIAKRHSGRVHTIDGDRDPQEVQAELRAHVSTRFGLE